MEEEELFTISFGGHFYKVTESMAREIFTALIETPPIDYEKSMEEANEIADNIRKMKDEGNY